jgi:hypothetical protein
VALRSAACASISLKPVSGQCDKRMLLGGFRPVQIITEWAVLKGGNGKRNGYPATGREKISLTSGPLRWAEPRSKRHNRTATHPG